LDENSCPIYTTEGNFNIELKLSGNIINDLTLNLHAKQSSAYGIFAELFKDIEKSFDESSDVSSDKITVTVNNSNAELKKINISFIDVEGNPYKNNPIYVTSIGKHSAAGVRMKIEFNFEETIVTKDENGNDVTTVEYTTSTYIINDISHKRIFEVDTEGVSHIWRPTTYNRQSDNYYYHVFNSLNFVSPPIGATETYDIYNSSGTAESNKKIIIKDDFSIHSLNLTLSKRTINNSDVTRVISSSYKTTTSEKKYKA
jgi:hypothetical protein